MLRGGLIDWHTGGRQQRRAILAVAEAASGVQHAGLTQPGGGDGEGR